MLHVNAVIGVGCDGRIGVLLPGEGLRPADDNLDAVVLNGAGEGLRQSSLGDECLHGFFDLRTEGFEVRFGFITSYLCSKKLVDNFILGCHSDSALFPLVPCEGVKN